MVFGRRQVLSATSCTISRFCLGFVVIILVLVYKAISPSCDTVSECGDHNTLTYEYEFIKHSDVMGRDLMHVQSVDLEMVRRVCNLFKECLAFNSNGWLKTSASTLSTNQASIYVKKKPGNSERTSSHQHVDSDYNEMIANMKVFVYSTEVGIEHRPPRTDGYAVERVFVEQLLKSSFVTNNPQEATFFFIPTRCSSYILDASTEYEGVTQARSVIGAILQEIQNNFPYWSWSHGADHFYICAHDIGSSINEDVLKNSIALVNTADYADPYFVPNKDISLPPTLSSDMQSLAKSELGSEYISASRKVFAFFAGDLTSGRLRPTAWKHWFQDKEILLFNHKLSSARYTKFLKTSKYCLVFRGREAWSPRLIEAILTGCVPVIVSDHYHLPFQGILDWNEFSVIVPEAKVFQLKAILKRISLSKLASMQSKLREVHHHFIWNNPAKSNDAFYSVMLELWKRRHVIRYKLTL